MKIANGSIQKSKKNNNSGNMNGMMASTTAKHEVDPTQHAEMVAVAAYYRAQQRGFIPGNELDDWFQAEAELETIGYSPAN